MFNAAPKGSLVTKSTKNSNFASAFYAFHYKTLLKFCIMRHCTAKQKLKEEKAFCDYNKKPESLHNFLKDTSANR